MDKLVSFIIYTNDDADPDGDSVRFIQDGLLPDNDFEIILNTNRFDHSLNVKSIITEDRYAFYNEAKSNSTGQYLCFMTDTSFMDISDIECLKIKLRENEMITLLTPYYINSKGTKKIYKNFSDYEDDVNVSEKLIDLFLDSYFIPGQLIEDIPFSQNLNIDQSSEFIGTLMRIDNKVKILNAGIFSYLPFESQYTLYHNQTYEWWYKEDMSEFIIPFFEKNMDNTYLRQFVFYLIQIKLICNEGVHYKEVITGEDIDIFLDGCRQVLIGLSDDEILTSFYSVLPQLAYTNLVRFKYGKKDLKLSLKSESGDNFIVYNDKIKLFDLSEEKIKIQVIDYKSGNLFIDGAIPNANLFIEGAEIYFTAGEIDIKLNNTNVFSSIRFFGRTMYKDYTFSVSIPVDDIPNTCSMRFEYRYNDIVQPMIMSFTSPFSKLNGKKYSYWCFEDKLISYNGKARAIKCRRKKLRVILKREYLALKEARKYDKENNTDFFKLRLRYWLTYIKYNRKNIWVYYDKITRGGDNADYQFRYSVKQDDGIGHYYVLNKDAPAFDDMKKEYGNMLAAETLKQKLLVLHSNIIFSTHADPLRFLQFKSNFEKTFFRNLFNSDVVFSYHGLVIPQLAANIRRVRANTKRFYCVSKYEISNLAQPAYGYKENQLKLLGYPRFDGLVNRDKKQILITPTWRRGLTKLAKIDKSNISDSAGFKETEYYNVYNELINDRRLHECANSNGYKIVFLLHSRLAEQVDQFDNKYNIEITSVKLGGVTYEDILSESSLMLTDYTGVQFDFAYMRKPIVYFQPDELAPQYENGVFDYQSMGFGPICKKVDDTVDILIDYIQDNCKNKPEYLDRIDDFYKYDDKNNCKRIYDDILKYQNEK